VVIGGNKMSGFIDYHSEPEFLLPQRIGDLISQDDLSWVIMEITDRLDVSKITNQYSFLGTNAYHPRLLNFIKKLLLPEIRHLK
jgi:hypothetical protein